MIGWLAALGLVFLGWWLARRWDAWRGNRRRERGLAGEQQAEVLLRRWGFRILERQAERVVRMEVEGEEWECPVRADFLVERDGRSWVVEVKTGQRAPDPSNGSTRRQLLEYCLVFGSDRLLLLDMESQTLRTIVFPSLRRLIPWWRRW